MRKTSRPKSKPEQTLDRVLKEVFPLATVIEQMPVKIGKSTLFVDRVLPEHGLAFEIDGRQHDEFVEHFHQDKAGFVASKERDRLKSAWLTANGLTLVRIKHNEPVTAESIRKKVLKALNART